VKCGNQLSVIIVLVYVPISVCNEFVLVSLQFKPKLISHGELLRLLFKQQTKVFRGAFPKKGSFYFHKFCGPLFVPNSFCGCFSFQIHFAAHFSFQIHFAAAFRSKFILRPAGNACHFAARWECMSFCGPLFVPNSFCGPLFVPNSFCCPLFVPNSFCGPLFVPNSFCGCFSFQIHFAARWECMSFCGCGPLLVKNSFCGPLLVNVILRIAKIDNDPFFGNAPRFQCDQQSKLKLERRAAACRRVSKGQTQV